MCSIATSIAAAFRCDLCRAWRRGNRIGVDGDPAEAQFWTAGADGAAASRLKNSQRKLRQGGAPNRLGASIRICTRRPDDRRTLRAICWRRGSAPHFFVFLAGATLKSFSFPPALRAAVTHRGFNPRPAQVSAGFSGLRYFGSTLPRAPPLRSTVAPDPTRPRFISLD
jgi:hypothetical protein